MRRLCLSVSSFAAMRYQPPCAPVGFHALAAPSVMHYVTVSRLHLSSSGSSTPSTANNSVNVDGTPTLDVPQSLEKEVPAKAVDGVDSSNGGMHFMRSRGSKSTPSSEGGLESTKTHSDQKEGEGVVRQGWGDVVAGVQKSEEDEVTKAFNRFSESIGGCTAHSFQEGVQQVYYSLAVMMGVFAENAKLIEGPMDGRQRAQAAKDACAFLTKNFLSPEEWPGMKSSTEEKATAAKAASPMGDSVAAIRNVVAGIQTIVPMSASFAETVFKTWCAHREHSNNVFTIACPNDHIISTELFSFGCIDDRSVYLAPIMGGTTTININVHHLKNTAGKQTTANSSQSPSENATATPQSDATVGATAETSTATANSANEPAEGAAVTDAVYVDINGMVFPPIPSSALAFALVAVDVAVPPQRYARYYEWFYHRIAGHQSEYERMAAASVFATKTPKALASAFDFLARMFTGEPVQFLFSPQIRKLIGIPENVAECPTVARKFVCMYMDESKRWVLSGLHLGDLIQLPFRPKPAK